MKIAIKKSDQQLYFTDTNQVYRCNVIKEQLGNSLTYQAVWLDCDRCLAFVCDEDGLYKRLPLNFFIETPTSPWPVQAVVGDVIFIRTKPVNVWEQEIYDYEVANITDEDICLINKMLSWETQRRLCAMYADRWS